MHYLLLKAPALCRFSDCRCQAPTQGRGVLFILSPALFPAPSWQGWILTHVCLGWLLHQPALELALPPAPQRGASEVASGHQPQGSACCKAPAAASAQPRRNAHLPPTVVLKQTKNPPGWVVVPWEWSSGGSRTV